MDSYNSDTDPDVFPILDYLENHMPGYPFESEIDTPFVHELVEDFSADHPVDLREQRVPSFRVWKRSS